MLQQQRHHPRVARLGRQVQRRPGLAILLRLDLLVDVEPVQRQARVLPPLSLPLLLLLLLLALQPPPLEQERHQLHVVVGGRQVQHGVAGAVDGVQVEPAASVDVG